MSRAIKTARPSTRWSSSSLLGESCLQHDSALDIASASRLLNWQPPIFTDYLFPCISTTRLKTQAQPQPISIKKMLILCRFLSTTKFNASRHTKRTSVCTPLTGRVCIQVPRYQSLLRTVSDASHRVIYLTVPQRNLLAGLSKRTTQITTWTNRKLFLLARNWPATRLCI